MYQTEHTFHVNDDLALGYLLYLPQNYRPQEGKHWPLLIFLHGSGERGSDLSLVKKYPLPGLIDNRPDFPFVVASPQCPPDLRWTDLADAVIALLDHLLARQRLDPRRVSLTGLSMGGQGVWHIGALHPNRFAALVPVAGRTPPDPHFQDRLYWLKTVPTWVFHGGKDDVVPPSHSIELAGLLQSHGGDVRLTLFPDAGHPASKETYTNAELFAWLQGCVKQDT